MMNMILSTGSAAQVAFHVTDTIETIVAIGGVCVVLPIVIVWMVVRARTHRMDKKMEILMKAVENGQQVDPALLVTAQTGGRKYSLKKNILNRLLFGVIFSMAGLMLLIVTVLSGSKVIYMDKFSLLLSLLFISIGAGLLISYFIGRRLLAKEMEIEEKELLEEVESQLEKR